MSLNICSFTGNITKEPVIRTSQTNDGELTIATFSLAINNGKDDTLFLNCVAFNQKATLIKDYVSKGSKLGISGKLTQRTYEKQDGTKNTVIELIVDSIEFLSPKKQEETNYVGDRTLEENEQEFKDLPEDGLPF